MPEPENQPSGCDESELRSYERVGKHYVFDFQGVRLDPYRILAVYGITHPAHQHALKKLLRAGNAHKTLRQDIDEVIGTLERWKGMLDEEEDKKDQPCGCPLCLDLDA